MHSEIAEHFYRALQDEEVELLNSAIGLTETMLPELRFWPHVDAVEEYNFEMLFRIALSELDMDSVPGECCLNKYGSTNREIFGYENGILDASRVKLVRIAVKDRYDSVTKGERVADPLKVFVKQEPHKRTKLQEGRIRLIMSVSLVDTIVDRILFRRIMYRATQNFSKTNIMIGWSPVSGGYRLIQAKFAGVDTISIDKKSWDWTVKIWLLHAVKDLIVRLANDAPEWWLKAVDTRFHMLFEDPTFIFGDGVTSKQRMPGIMKSGCYLTILINSLAQLILHNMALVKLQLPKQRFICIGDDTVQESFPEVESYISFLEHLGFRIEHEFRPAGEIEFAGFIYDENNFQPAYVNKHLFALRHLTLDEEIAGQTLANYQLLYVFVPHMLKYIRTILRNMNLPSCYVSDYRLRAIALG